MNRRVRVCFDELTVQLGRAPAHFEHTGQQALGCKALLDAGLHDGPEAQERGTGRARVAKRRLVGEHQFVQLQPVAPGDLQQLIARVERGSAPAARTGLPSDGPVLRRLR